LKNARDALWCGLICFVFVVAGIHAYGAVGNVQQNRPAEQQARTGYKQPEAPARADTSARVEGVAQNGKHGPEAPRQNVDPSQEAVAYYTFWLTWFTGIMAVGTLGLFVVTYIAAVAAKRSADVARDTLIAAQRPWVSVQGIEIRGPLTFEDGEARIDLRFNLKNVGNSPARRVSINAKLIISNNVSVLAEQRRFADHFRRNPAHNEIRPEVTLWPGETLDFPRLVFMQGDDMPRIKEWADRASPHPIALPLLIGCVDYEFTFAEGHHQTALIYDLHRVDQFAAEGQTVLGAIPLEGTIPEHDLNIRLNFVGTGPID
jgi:hypothetical protein